MSCAQVAGAGTQSKAGLKLTNIVGPTLWADKS